MRLSALFLSLSFLIVNCGAAEINERTPPNERVGAVNDEAKRTTKKTTKKSDVQKSAKDAEGLCIPEVLQDYKTLEKMNSEGLVYSVSINIAPDDPSVLDWRKKLKTAELEFNKYCDRFQKTWGNFSCAYPPQMQAKFNNLTSDYVKYRCDNFLGK